MKRNVSAFLFVVAATVASCAPTGEVEYAGEVHVTSPDLVMVSPGVEVVADADEPLFYADGNYWLYRDSNWYRSDSYRGGFARVEYSYVPQPIRVIERPQAYVQYRRHAGRDEYARQRQMQTRSRQTQSPATSIPSQPDTYRPGDAHPTPRPEGINPQVSTTPPAAVTPNNPGRTHEHQVQQPIDRANPPAPGTAAPTNPANPQPTRPADRFGHPGNSDYAPGQNRDIRSPGNSSSAPGHNQDVRSPDNRGAQSTRPDHRDQDVRSPGNADHGNHDDRSNHGNPSAPSRIAPTAPTNIPASPSAGAARDADKDKHDHADSAKTHGHSDNADQKRDKKSDK